MPTTINPLITNGGLSAAIAANGSGLQLAITHLVLGTGQFTPVGTETALANRKEKVTISGGFVSGTGGFRVNALFPPWAGTPNPYNATEIGFYAGDPDAGGILFAIYSHVSNVLVVRNSLNYIASFGLQLNRVPTGSVTITLDPSGAQALALVAAHEAATNPHPQYATVASLSAHVGGSNPHSQYALLAGAAFSGAVSATGFTGPLTGNATTATNASSNLFATAGNGAVGSENTLIAKCNGYADAYLYNNGTAWGLYSSGAGPIVSYNRAAGKATFTGEATALNANTNYAIKNQLTFSNNGGQNGYILSNDANYGMMYQPGAAGSINLHSWNNAAGSGLGAFQASGLFYSVAGFTTVGGLTASGTINGGSFTGAGTGLTGTAGSLNIGGNAAIASSLNSGLNYTIRDTLLFNNGGTGAGRIIANDATYGMAYRPSANGSTFIHAFANDAGSVVANLTASGLFSTPSLFLSGSNSSPLNPANFTLRTSNGFGGGWSMTDSGYGLGIYSVSGVMTFGLGTNTSISGVATLSSVNGGTFTCGYIQGNHTGTIDSATTGTTQAANDNSTKLATTAHVQANKTNRAWVHFTGATGTINASFGVSSVTRVTNGQYTVNLSTAQPNANLCPVTTTGAFKIIAYSDPALMTTTSYSISTFDSTNGTGLDALRVYSALFGA